VSLHGEFDGVRNLELDLLEGPNVTIGLQSSDTSSVVRDVSVL